MNEHSAPLHFFISYTQPDRAWAEWIAWQLEANAYTVFLQAWDITPGHDFVHEMHESLRRAEHVIAVLSPSYISSAFGEAEWRSAFVDDPGGAERRLVPVRVADIQPPGLLRTRVYIDLVGLDEHQANARLLDGLPGAASRPAEAPPFPSTLAVGEGAPSYPPLLPSVFGVPHQSSSLFIGRDSEIAQIRTLLERRSPSRVVIAGIGGVGKTQLAAQFAYAASSRYDVVWWVRADTPLVRANDYITLADQPHVDTDLNRATAASIDAKVQLVRAWYERHERWLLILDDVSGPDVIHDLLPRVACGDVLITSRRDTGWEGLAERLDLDVLDRESSVAFLKARSNDDDSDAARDLANLLGDLPLALEQAAGFIAESHIDLAEYSQLYRRRAVELLERGAPQQYGATVNTTWSLALSDLRQMRPAAVDLLSLTAFLAPADIDFSLLTREPALMPSPLSEDVGDPLELGDLVAALRRYGLVRTSGTAVSVHTLLQAVVRSELNLPSRKTWALTAARVLNAAHPSTPKDTSSWALAQHLTQHVTTIVRRSNELNIASFDLLNVALQAARYALVQGQVESALNLIDEALLHTDMDELLHSEPDLAIRIADARGMGLRMAADHDAAARVYEELRGSLSRVELELPSRVMVNYASVLLGQRRLDDAESYLRQGATSAAAEGDEWLEADARGNLAIVLRDQNRLTEARLEVERSIAIRTRLVAQGEMAPDHFSVADDIANLGTIQYDLGDFDSALASHERALNMHRASVGNKHPSTAMDYGNIGNTLIRLERRDEAADAYESAAAIFDDLDDYPRESADLRSKAQEARSKGL